ncbi:hypothetical protein [Cohnella nanjingensis]|uniref:Uncharacterized protein n=1 Tax=Cohnella nanjingensis TaxID=1387779 RepID=A0A7X0RUT8_9BACL|nr:hypothetical protein [Cohnella nanjingensis]MBB6672810.1 hypothetical protein [Cohnella nanjingensis]
MNMRIAARLLFALIPVWFLCGEPALANTPRPTVSVFDVRQEKVVAVWPLTEALQARVLSALEASPVTYANTAVDPKDGWVLHIPFAAPVRPRHAFYARPVQEAYLFLAPGQQPYALLFLTAKRHTFVVAELAFDPAPFVRMIEQSKREPASSDRHSGTG